MKIPKIYLQVGRNERDVGQARQGDGSPEGENTDL
jgi:hypothetical protein